MKYIDYSNPFPLVKGMEIPGLKRRRQIWAFLPPGYAEHPEKRYPVIYFQDAQNIFEGWKAAFGTSWEVHNTMKQLGYQGFEQCILIGIEHGNSRRFKEYQPFTHNGHLAHQGNAYADFIAHKLKNYVDKKLRTLPDRHHTALVGSSMGGLMTLYAGMKHQHVFSRLGVFSPSLWSAPAIYSFVKNIGRRHPMKVYLSIGQKEGNYAVKDTEAMFQTLTYAGFPQHELYYSFQPNGKHEEYFWQQEFATCYQWFQC